MINKIHKIITHTSILIIKIYQTCISPLLNRNCRYTPTCSQYTKQAIQKYGIKGIWTATKRIARCHPWSKHGYDPLK